MGNSFYGTSQSTLVSMYSDKSGQGKSQGCFSALQAVAGMAAPVVGGVLVDYNYNINPWVTCGGFVLGFFIIYVVYQLHKRLPENEEAEQQPAAPDVDVELKKKSPMSVEMDPAEEVKLLRSRVAELEQQVQELHAQNSQRSHH